jgi:hypothetical protein
MTSNNVIIEKAYLAMADGTIKPILVETKADGTKTIVEEK